MTVPTDVIGELARMGLGGRVPAGSNGHGDDMAVAIEAKRQAVAKMTEMADIMSRLVTEVRDTARDLNAALLKMTEELRSLTEGKT